MNKKLILILLTGTIIFSLLFGYSLVFAGTPVFDSTTKVVFKLSNNIYLDSLELKNTKIVIKSGDDLSDYKIKSECNIFSKVSYNKGDYYMYDIKFFDNLCTNDNFSLTNREGHIMLNFKLNLIKGFDVLSRLYDIKTLNLTQFKNILEKKVDLYKNFDTYNKSIEENYYVYLEKNRVLKEAIFNLKLLENIINKRDEKYIVPVSGHEMPTEAVKIPNSGRGYRGDYTDGIHHGWDIDGDFGEPVIALSEGIIVRTVDKFDFSDLSEIKRGENLTYDEEIINLDILRGKQIWLKTLSGDIVMYSHLNDIYTNIKVGEFIQKGQPLGTIGITGVPDKNYKDFHLHFVVHKNPFIKEKVGQYDFDDYMKWDWAFKGETSVYIVENQNKYFENNVLLSKKG